MIVTIPNVSYLSIHYAPLKISVFMLFLFFGPVHKFYCYYTGVSSIYSWLHSACALNILKVDDCTHKLIFYNTCLNSDHNNNHSLVDTNNLLYLGGWMNRLLQKRRHVLEYSYWFVTIVIKYLYLKKLYQCCLIFAGVI